jgi:hypothetical protein
MHWLFGIDQYILVLFGIVRCACSDAQHILLVMGYFWHCFFCWQSVVLRTKVLCSVEKKDDSLGCFKVYAHAPRIFC